MRNFNKVNNVDVTISYFLCQSYITTRRRHMPLTDLMGICCLVDDVDIRKTFQPLLSRRNQTIYQVKRRNNKYKK